MGGILGNLGPILQQIATAISGTGAIPVAIATIALAVAFLGWMFGRISALHLGGTIAAIVFLGSLGTIVPMIL